MKATRRDFIKASVGAIAAKSGNSANMKGVSCPAGSGERAAAPGGEAGNMIYRQFGRMDARISAIGVGGHHLGDVASLGEAALRGGRRDKVFLMTEVCTHGR